MDKKQMIVGAALTKDDMIATLEDLIARARRGELDNAAFRCYMADGTYLDIAIGGSPEEKDCMLAELQEVLARKAN